MTVGRACSPTPTGAPVSSRSWTVVLRFCGLIALSCGDTLVPGSSLDKVPFSMTGVITTATPESLRAPLRLGLLWVDPAQVGKGNYVSGSELVRGKIEPDGTYTLGLVGPPPAGAIRALKSSADGGPTFAFAWAEIILYEDRNGDGTFAVGPLAEDSPMVSPDVYRGMPTDRVLLYLPQTLPSAQQVIPEFLIQPEKGYHVGLVHCQTSDQSPAISPVVMEVTPPYAPIELVEPSASFPNLRSCLQSQPVLPDQ